MHYGDIKQVKYDSKSTIYTINVKILYNQTLSLKNKSSMQYNVQINKQRITTLHITHNI